MSETRDFIDDHEAARLLGCGRTILRKAARRGDVPCQILGERYIFSPDALRDWVSFGRDVAVLKPSRASSKGVISPNDKLRELIRRSEALPERARRRGRVALA